MPTKSGRKTRKKKKAEEVFHVEVITEARVCELESEAASLGWEYLVKWAGYDSDANSWEPEDNLSGCSRLLASFWNHVGLDNNDYHLGDIQKASPEWIQKEKDFFAEEYKTAQAEIKRKKKERREIKHAKRGEGKGASAEPSSASIRAKKVTTDSDLFSSSDESSEGMITMPPKPSSNQGASTSLKITIPASSSALKRKRIVSSSSEDEPLISTRSGGPRDTTKTTESDFQYPAETIVPSAPQSPSSLFSEPSSPDTALASKMKTKPPAPPKEDRISRRRTLNPQASIASMAPSEIPAAGGISTKQRIAQGALAPMPPKQISEPQPSAQPKLARGSKYADFNLSFKKRKMGEPQLAALIPRHEPTLASLNSPIDQPSPSAGFLPPRPSFAPSGQQVVNNRLSRPEATVAPSAIFPDLAPATEVDNFMRNIMPPELAAPMDMVSDSPIVEIPALKPLHTKTPLPSRIQKTWSWTGQLFIQPTGPSWCNVEVHNITPPKERSLHFSMVFDNMEKLHFASLYHIMDIRLLLHAFRKPPQLAQVKPAMDTDTQPLGILSNYLEKMQKALSMPMKLDGNTIGQFLCFPHKFSPLLGVDNLPQELSNQGDLVLAIFPYTLGLWDLATIIPPKPSLKTTFHFHRAMRMLRFPSNLVNYVGNQEFKRPCMIWAGRDPVVAQHGGKDAFETRLLEGLLDHVKAIRGSKRSNTRIIFIHISALKIIHHLPEFVERRANHPSVQFYTYGSDPSVHPSLWQVKEIWPCGGIITFTPNAMAKDPSAVHHLITQLSAHPLWACYIVPSALGMLATMECGTEDPLKVFGQRILRMDPILQAIEDGDVALLEAPPEKPMVKDTDTDPHAQWLSKYIAFIPPTKREALAHGVAAHGAFRALGSKRTIETELSADMGRMHRHPAFMFQRRRYVVICAEGDSPKVGTDAFEWTPIAKFDFKDDFYPKQTVGGK